jgi:hypothetical protein
MVTLEDTFEEVGSAEYGPWQYKAVVYDDGEKDFCIHRGICFGTDYGSAARKVETYFQKDLINLTLYPLEPSPVYDFTNAWETEQDLFTINVYDNQNKF